MLVIIRFFLNLLPRIRGASIGRNSLIGPGCDWIQVSWRKVYIGKNVIIGRRAWIQTLEASKGEIRVGDGTHIGRDVVISSAVGIDIGGNCLFSYRVSILDHEHEFTYQKSPISGNIGKRAPIRIGERTFVGANVTILCGSQIGQDCIIGANSLVKGLFPAGSIIAGVPARIVGNRYGD